MWAVQPRFERDLPAFAERARELGYGAIEINHSMDAAQARALLAQDRLPVTAVHAPAPHARKRKKSILFAIILAIGGAGCFEPISRNLRRQPGLE